MLEMLVGAAGSDTSKVVRYEADDLLLDEICQSVVSSTESRLACGIDGSRSVLWTKGLEAFDTLNTSSRPLLPSEPYSTSLSALKVSVRSNAEVLPFCSAGVAQRPPG